MTRGILADRPELNLLMMVFVLLELLTQEQCVCSRG